MEDATEDLGPLPPPVTHLVVRMSNSQCALMAAATRRSAFGEVRSTDIPNKTMEDAELYLAWLKEWQD